tara:strand:- start:7896 stop:8579 length:684 start_codon:yes stop_codon:yes gene_type:complete
LSVEVNEINYKKQYDDAGGVLEIKEFLPPPVAAIFMDYMINQINNQEIDEVQGELDFIPDALVNYGDNLTEAFLGQVTQHAESFIGEELYPTYSYMRYYKKGQGLPVHTDRVTCEISATMHIGSTGSNNPWPIYIESPVDRYEITQNPGDIAFYAGTENKHWRDKFTGDWFYQWHLHWVRKSSIWGEELKFDTRPALGLPISTRNPHIMKKWMKNLKYKVVLEERKR